MDLQSPLVPVRPGQSHWTHRLLARPCSARMVAPHPRNHSQARPHGSWSHLHSYRPFGFAIILQPGDHRHTRHFRFQKRLKCERPTLSRSSIEVQSLQSSQKLLSLTRTFLRRALTRWIRLISGHSDLSDPLLLRMRSISIYQHRSSTNPTTNPRIIPHHRSYLPHRSEHVHEALHKHQIPRLE